MNEALKMADLIALKKEIFASLHCALPGTVVSFDEETQTAVIRPGVSLRSTSMSSRAERSGVEGSPPESFPLPLLRDVPVFMPLHYSVSPGDSCLIVFADLDVDAWLAEDESGLPRSERSHSLSDGFAFVGFRGGEAALRDYYTKSQTDGLLAGKSDTGHNHDESYYTRSLVDSLLAGKKDTQSSVPDPAVSGTAISFIDSIVQDAQGKISATKKTVQNASSSQNGLMAKGDKSKLDGMAMVSFGTCDTAAGTAAKVVTISNASWQLKVGSVIGVKFTNTNTFSATADSHVSLNVNSTGAKNIYYSNTSAPTGTNTTAFGYAGRITWYMYDGTYWVWMGVSAEFNDNTIPSGYCVTAAATAAKTASCTYFSLLSKCHLQVLVRYANTAASALTLNVNSTGAKPIYINGSASGASNYTLPAGTYLVYYDGTNYHFRTDGYLPGPTLSVGFGGSGQTGTGATSTVADIAAAATDCSITTAQYAYWGKVAMVRLTVKKTAAVSSGTTTLCTLVSGKRPKYVSSAQRDWNGGAIINTSGTVQVNGAISAGASVNVYATFILA